MQFVIIFCVMFPWVLRYAGESERELAMRNHARSFIAANNQEDVGYYHAYLYHRVRFFAYNHTADLFKFPTK